MPYLELAAGAILLYFGAEWLVRGASRLALALGIPSLVVGLTVVAFGTSAPEAVVSIQAALAGEGDIALGNVIGSNIANIGLILGLATLVAPARVAPGLLGRDLPVLLGSALALAWVLDGNVVERGEGLALLAVFAAYTAWTLAGARSARSGPTDAAVRGEGEAWRDALVAGLGLALLLWGGKVCLSAAQRVWPAPGVSANAWWD